MDQRLIRLRVELYGAAQILKGDDLKEFTALIREIAAILNVIPIEQAVQPEDMTQ